MDIGSGGSAPQKPTIRPMLDFHNYTLSAKEAWERKDELEAQQDEDCSTAWFITTKEWEEWASSPEELAEFTQAAIKEGLYAQITGFPF